jgi:hypothetical protein
MKPDRYVAKCLACEADACPVHVIERLGQKDLGICKGCPCAEGVCVSCGRVGEHWLGCAVVGLPEGPGGATIQ